MVGESRGNDLGNPVVPKTIIEVIAVMVTPLGNLVVVVNYAEVDHEVIELPITNNKNFNVDARCLIKVRQTSIELTPNKVKCYIDTPEKLNGYIDDGERLVMVNIETADVMMCISITDELTDTRFFHLDSGLEIITMLEQDFTFCVAWLKTSDSTRNIEVSLAADIW